MDAQRFKFQPTLGLQQVEQRIDVLLDTPPSLNSTQDTLLLADLFILPCNILFALKDSAAKNHWARTTGFDNLTFVHFT